MSTTGGKGEFRVGGVIKRSFSILLTNAAPFGLLALLITVPGLLLAWGSAPPAPAAEAENYSINFSFGAEFSSILDFFLAFVLMAALTYGSFQALKGRKGELFDYMAKGLTFVLPVLAIAFVLVLLLAALVALFAGTAVLGQQISNLLPIIALPLIVVLGFYVYIGLWAAIPVVVVERPGVFNALRRSWDLANGYRWRIFAVLLILIVIQMVLGAAVYILAAFLRNTALISIIGWVQSAFVSALFAVCATVGYHDLRVAKEGIGVDEIAAVFD